MSVTYTKEAKDEAKERNLKLATVSAAGMLFQGPVTAEEERKLVRFYMEFTDNREKNPLPVLPPKPPAPPAPPAAPKPPETGAGAGTGEPAAKGG